MADRRTWEFWQAIWWKRLCRRYPNVRMTWIQLYCLAGELAAQHLARKREE